MSCRQKESEIEQKSCLHELLNQCSEIYIASPPQCILYQDMHLIIHSCGCSLCFSILGLFCDASGKITRCIGYQLLATFRTLLHFLWSSWLAVHVCVVTTQTNAAQLIRKIKDYNERKKSTNLFFVRPHTAIMLF